MVHRPYMMMMRQVHCMHLSRREDTGNIDDCTVEIGGRVYSVLGTISIICYLCIVACQKNGCALFGPYPKPP